MKKNNEKTHSKRNQFNTKPLLSSPATSKPKMVLTADTLLESVIQNHSDLIRTLLRLVQNLNGFTFFVLNLLSSYGSKIGFVPKVPRVCRRKEPS